MWSPKAWHKMLMRIQAATKQAEAKGNTAFKVGSS
jgi:hypothetical protein